MKRENINYIVVGSFVVSMLVAFFVVMYQVTGRTGPTDQYLVMYSNVTGVKYGTPVLYEGYQIGQVEEIVPDRKSGKTRYKLTLAVQKGWQIPADSIASMLASGLLSAITIDIKEGKSTTFLQPGEYLQGREAPNLFAAVNDVAAEIQDLSRESIRPLVENLNTQVNDLSAQFKSLTNESLRPMIDNLNAKLNQDILSDMSDLLQKLNQAADKMLSSLNDKNLKNLDEFLANMEAASSTLNEVIFRIEDTRAAMNQVLLNVNGVISDNQESLKASMTDMQKSLNIISQNINSIVYHMEGSSRNIHELSRQLRENPSLIIKSSPQAEPEEKEPEEVKQ